MGLTKCVPDEKIVNLLVKTINNRQYLFDINNKSLFTYNVEDVNQAEYLGNVIKITDEDCKCSCHKKGGKNEKDCLLCCIVIAWHPTQKDKRAAFEKDEETKKKRESKVEVWDQEKQIWKKKIAV